MLFKAHLVEIGRQSSTAKTYISAIKAVLVMEGISLKAENYELRALTRACRRIKDRVKMRLPIGKRLIRLLLDKIDVMLEKQNYVRIMYKALFVLAYYGHFRVGELSKGDHPVHVTDVHVGRNKRKMQIILRTSKTHGLGDNPQKVMIKSFERKLEFREMRKSHKIVDIEPQDRCFCPYNLVQDYVDIRDGYNKADEPFFTFRDGRPVTPVQVRTVLNDALTAVGLKVEMYGTHQFSHRQSNRPNENACSTRYN